MSILERELDLERSLFFFLNGSDSSFLDHFFYWYSQLWAWFPFYACFIAAVIINCRKNWKEIALFLFAAAALILLCDQLSSSVCKPLFHRFRPTHHPAFKDAVDTVTDYLKNTGDQYLGGLYGFISGHAANSFGFATFAALLLRKRIFTITVFLFALLNAYSRIYIGVHFISDIVAGALAGVLIGYLVFYLYNLFRKKKMNAAPIEFPAKTVISVCATYYISIFVIILFSL